MEWEFGICLQSEEQKYELVDVELKDDNYIIVEGSMRGMPKG